MILESLFFAAFLNIPTVKKDVDCLASVIHHEARGESLDGQIQVGNVVINRLKSKYFPGSICKVAYQNKQFSGLYNIKYTEKDYTVAKIVLFKVVKPKYKNSLYYHTKNVSPYWSTEFYRQGKIGNHIFYRRKS